MEMAKRLLERHGVIRSQPPSDWCGSFDLPPAVALFYWDVGPANIAIEGYGNQYFLPSLTDLWQFQAGYRWNGIDGTRIEGWKDEWLVVADEGGDPFIFDMTSGVVLHAFHGEGVWDAIELFPDLNAMGACLAQLGAIVNEFRNSYLDADHFIRREFRELASTRVHDILGSLSAATLVLARLGWN